MIYAHLEQKIAKRFRMLQSVKLLKILQISPEAATGGVQKKRNVLKYFVKLKLTLLNRDSNPCAFQ